MAVGPSITRACQTERPGTGTSKASNPVSERRDMKIAERPVALSIVVMLGMVCLATGGCRSSERARTPPDAQAPKHGVHDSLGPGTLISLLRRQATATDPVEIGHVISCEIGRLHLTVGEERA